jgi:hypothetical protein
MTKTVQTIKIVGSNALEITEALATLLATVRILDTVSKQFATAASCVDVEDQDGAELSSLDLIEETLSDNSKVYNIRLRFSMID